jgi:hypothetical protein
VANESQVLTITGSESDKRSTAEVALIISSIPGYDAEETQTLKHVSGVLTWVTDAP